MNEVCNSVVKAGVFWMELMSYYVAGRSLILMGTMESVIFAWIYGKHRFDLLNYSV